MKSEGLRVEGPEPIHIARVNATDDPREVGTVDFVMLCVKLWDTDGGSGRRGQNRLRGAPSE
jgi:2-dehydropantoate 2-reductase